MVIASAVGDGSRWWQRRRWWRWRRRRRWQRHGRPSPLSPLFSPLPLPSPPSLRSPGMPPLPKRGSPPISSTVFGYLCSPSAERLSFSNSQSRPYRCFSSAHSSSHCSSNLFEYSSARRSSSASTRLCSASSSSLCAVGRRTRGTCSGRGTGAGEVSRGGHGGWVGMGEWVVWAGVYGGDGVMAAAAVQACSTSQLRRFAPLLLLLGMLRALHVQAHAPDDGRARLEQGVPRGTNPGRPNATAADPDAQAVDRGRQERCALQTPSHRRRPRRAPPSPRRRRHRRAPPSQHGRGRRLRMNVGCHRRDHGDGAGAAADNLSAKSRCSPRFEVLLPAPTLVVVEAAIAHGGTTVDVGNPNRPPTLVIWRCEAQARWQCVRLHAARDSRPVLDQRDWDGGGGWE